MAMEKPIKPGTKKATLDLTSTDSGVDLKVDIEIGYLDPIDTVTGQIGRLNNLGYDAGAVQEPAT